MNQIRHTTPRRVPLLVLTLLLASLLAGCYASDRQPDRPGVSKEQELVNAAAETVRAMRADSQYQSLNTLLADAHGVLVLPAVYKAGFIYGGEGGSGVLLARSEGGSWSAPAFYTMGGGSFGLQIGAQKAQIILVFMNKNAFRGALDSGLTLGADATVAAGPKGTSREASTVTVKDVYYFAEVDGLYAGLTLEGSVIAIRDSMNANYYEQGAKPYGIVIEGEFPAPGADGLRQALR